eukprot:GDKK01048638.1.p1 GENE.GDKK01048638.1~~GDKK01048638.1.p1  ORF type:complete len:102 (-),score=24.08 GDKK01048638.1:460-765(-)
MVLMTGWVLSAVIRRRRCELLETELLVGVEVEEDENDVRIFISDEQEKQEDKAIWMKVDVFAIRWMKKRNCKLGKQKKEFLERKQEIREDRANISHIEHKK